jgi:hypothetical protein
MQQQPHYYGHTPIPNLPPRPPKTWWQRNGLLVGLLGGALLLIGLGIWFAVSIAGKISSGITQVTSGAMDAMTTIDENENTYDYDNLYTMCNNDSIKYASFRIKLDELKAASNEVSAEIHRQHIAFSDTLKKEKAGLLNGIVITKAFFLSSGRAEKLRNMCANYGRQSLRITGEEKSTLDDEFYIYMPLDDESYAYTNWKRHNFSSEPLTAKSTLVNVINDLRTFESNRLDVLETQMYEIQNNDSTGHK